jgi:hypothetical protein
MVPKRQSTTTLAMISDPKLPFPGEPTVVETRMAPLAEAELENAPHAPELVSTSRLWLRRLGVLLFVFLCATLGVVLMILPWRPEWSENSLLFSYPAIHEIVTSGFVRGVVTGLGLINVCMGFWEAIRYRED